MPATDITVSSDERIFRTDHGPVSFGLVLSIATVPWSSPTAMDLLIGRCWEGIHLHPSTSIRDEELAREPIRVFPADLGDASALPLDWNRDGRLEIMAANRTGFLWPLARSGEYPGLQFELGDVLRDKRTRLPFSIPYDNPHHPVQDDLGGYLDPTYFNYIYPIAYPRRDEALDLIVGDWAGNLWWMPDESAGSGPVQYVGVPYEKDVSRLNTAFGRSLADRYGSRYVKPADFARDEDGRPLLLGEGVDAGVVYHGANTRPIVWRDQNNGTADLLVLAGAMAHEIHYLQRIAETSAGTPVFRNRGTVRVDWAGGLRDDGWLQGLNFHSKLAALPRGATADLIITCGNRLGMFRNTAPSAEVPAFRFSRWISARDATTSGANFTEILTDRRTGKRYLLDCPCRWEFREVQPRADGVRLSPAGSPLLDQAGVFSVEGETDPQLGAAWGWHRAHRWNFDGSGRQHLIVGTDKGLLYLLIEEEDLGANGEFRYKSVGPLKDVSGKTIRIHNRACAVGVDMDHDGREDLVAAGAPYQLGTRTDTSPAGGIYYVRHLGLDRDGLPILDSPQPLDVDGCDLPINSHVALQTLDIDGDGVLEVLITTQGEGCPCRAFRVADGEAALVPTGSVIKDISVEHAFLDLLGDGRLHLVFAGGENGVGWYREVRRGRI